MVVIVSFFRLAPGPYYILPVTVESMVKDSDFKPAKNYYFSPAKNIPSNV